MRDRSFLVANAPWLMAGTLLTFLSSFGQTYFISIFSGEIRAEFGLTHGQWGGIYSLGTTLSAAVMVWSGGLTDRFRSRLLGSGVLILLALACLAMAVSTVWLLPAVIFALRLTGQGMTVHIAAVSMARWFVASRGKALSIASVGSSLAEAVMPILFVALLTVWDWRQLWVLSALIAIAGVPLLRLLLRRERTPQSMAENDQSTGMKNIHWTRGQTLRHPLFWFMVPALLGPPAFITAFFFQQVHYAEIKGWTHLDLVSLFPIYTGFGIAAMLGSGWLLDRVGTGRLIPYYQLPMVVAFAWFAIAGSPMSALVGLFFLAMTAGANATLPNAFWAEFYGTANLGAIKAMSAAVMVLGSALGPGLTGALIDLGIGIETQYLFVAGYFIFATVMMKIGIAQVGHTQSNRSKG
ncbi:MFS transporter [Marinovum sp. 2_MG-2023]|uniref:MFS transporter n=2 Tax=unclassified Marinovum TaxID=2647166 RepID=UPI0026E1B25D|nr:MULTISPECIES: MFS transporter [unclassified Marinovum]MDO6729797.1 MFS transporter [Marinovum sp. 2_MG-2023]MDO6779611.1 MFS transporter [Marinovum sp. 1_MG-2023]